MLVRMHAGRAAVPLDDPMVSGDGVSSSGTNPHSPRSLVHVHPLQTSVTAQSRPCTGSGSVADALRTDKYNSPAPWLQGEHEHNTSSAQASAQGQRPQRQTTPIERFHDTKNSQWSTYLLSVSGYRHGAPLQQEALEAAEAEPQLADELEALFRRVHHASASTASELESEMQRVAATTLHAALIEVLGASTDEEIPHLWGEDHVAPTTAAAATAAVVHHVRVRFGDAQNGSNGVLAIAPPFLTFTPEGPAATAAAEAGEQLEPLFSWPLSFFVGADDDEEEHARCELRLLTGEDDGLLFGFENSIQLAGFEHALRIAATSARAVGGGFECSSCTEESSTAAAEQPRPAEASGARGSDDGPKRQRREEPRVGAGRELRSALGQVSTLFSNRLKGKAKAAMAAIELGRAAGAKTVMGRACELRDVLFTCGGFSVTKAVLSKFVGLKEVKLLLDEDIARTREELTDSKTATALLQAAKSFLNEMLAAKGRRTDVERNAFWASVVSLMPADLIENRQGRAMMRLLGIPYRTIKRGNVMRKALEESNRGWEFLETARHWDRAELHLKIIHDWWHSDEPSGPDNNQGKERVRVYRGYDKDPETGRRGYGMHDPRVQVGDDKHALSLWHKSEAAKCFREATATPKRPEGIKVSRKLLIECRCECIKKRKASFADCKICSFVTEGLKNWHRHRAGWRQAKPGCVCHLCSDPDKAQLYRSFSRSVREMKAALLPCGQHTYPGYSIAGGPTFKSYPGLCSNNKCPKRMLGQAMTPGACSWENVFGKDCPVEASSDKFTWYRWEPRHRSTNAEGKKFYSDEWVPHEGTRAEFIKELRAAIKDSYLPHDWRHILIRHGIKLHESRKDSTTATEWSDYAAVLDLTREKSVTCGVPERINELVTVIGYKPYEETVEMPKSRRHAATTKQVRKQHVDVFFAFHPSGYKADARSYNVVQVCLACTTHTFIWPLPFRSPILNPFSSLVTVGRRTSTPFSRQAK